VRAGTEAIEGSEAGEALSDWEAIRAAGDIQYAPLPPITQPEPPAWLEALGRFLGELLEPLARALGTSWPVLSKVLLALAAIAVLWICWRLLAPLLRGWRSGPSDPEPAWAPDRSEALALLEDADRLAGEGRYAEATHLLLRRSIAQIAQVRPDWLHPASTAREIAALPALPAPARLAFSAIAQRVERSRFALRALDGGDWTEARAAYAAFAVADLRA
jgi:hypothetical protein